MKKILIFILILLLFLATCKGKEAEENSNVYKPLENGECQAIQAKLEEALKTKFAFKPEETSDFPKGTGCFLEAKGDGTSFNLSDTPEIIKKTIAWDNEPNYAADGPTGTQSALKSGNKLLRYNINWEEASDAKCPDDKPIGDCEIQPEKQMYSVGIWIGRL